MGGSFTSKFNQPESETQKSAKRKPRPTTTDRPRPVDPTIQKQTPGPGEYYNPKLASSLNVSKKPPPNLQFFGSTSQRFSEPLSQKSEIPGPGAYNPDKPHKKLPEKELLGSGPERFKYQSAEVPGPGSYDYKGSMARHDPFSKDFLEYPPAFGSTVKRFNYEKQIVTN